MNKGESSLEWKEHILIVDIDTKPNSTIQQKTNLCLDHYDRDRKKIDIIFAQTKDQAISLLNWNLNITSIFLCDDCWNQIKDMWEIAKFARYNKRSVNAIIWISYNDNARKKFIEQGCEVSTTKFQMQFLINLIIITGIDNLIQRFHYSNKD